MTASLRILVADDDEGNALTLGELFEMEGHSVRIVHNGEDAVRAYMREDFDVAFMDVMMPGKNGVESFLEIRRMRPDAKVYMMTGYSVEQLLQQAMDSGALGVFTKPVDIRQLLRSLAAIEPQGIMLIADETPGFSGDLRRMMTDAGYSVDLMLSSEHSPAAAHAAGSILILDLRRPLIEGVGVYSRLKHEGRARPTIIITREGESGTGEFSALDDVAVTGILNKPFNPLELLERLPRLAA